MDPIEQMLIKEYGVKPELAKDAAARIKGTQNQDPDSANLVREAVEPKANEEIARLDSMKRKFERFTVLSKHRTAGRTLTEEDERFYQTIKSVYADKVRQRAGNEPAV